MSSEQWRERFHTSWGALALSAAGTLGIDIKPLLGLSTIFGFALSISAKSILSNTFSAAYVLWVRPFKRGDRITVAEFGKSDKHSGEVISVDYHFVKLRTDKGTILMVPSHSIYGKVVELNWSVTPLLWYAATQRSVPRGRPYSCRLLRS